MRNNRSEGEMRDELGGDKNGSRKEKTVRIVGQWEGEQKSMGVNELEREGKDFLFYFFTYFLQLIFILCWGHSQCDIHSKIVLNLHC